MKRFLVTMAVACAIAAPALAAQTLDNAAWGFRVTFPADVAQKVVGANGSTFVAYSADGDFGLTARRYDAPFDKPEAMLDFMTKPDSHETLVSAKPLTAPGAIGREVVLLRKPSAFSMETGYEVRRIYVRGNMVYRVDADYPEGGPDTAARAFVDSFTLR